MPKAYVGIASSHGLAVLQPERTDTLSLVRRRACDGTGVGFWAVLGDADARCVQVLLLGGHRRKALWLLDRSAKDMGCIVIGDGGGSRYH